MRWIWLLIWILLLLSQLVTALFLQRERQHAPHSVMADAPELLQLARAVDAKWEALRKGRSFEEGRPMDMLSRKQNNPFDRERLLLRIRDTEGQLVRSAVEVEVADMLRSWLEKGSLGPRPYSRQGATLAYLDGLLVLLGELSSADSRISIERLRLEPDGRTEFPVLYLEASGPPVEVGTLLMDGLMKAASWKLIDLELTGPPELDTWWTTGGCAFQPEGLP